MKLHSSIVFKFNGTQQPLILAQLDPMIIEPPRIFRQMKEEMHPIATKSRTYSDIDQKFIKEELQRLLHEGIIEPSFSAWRAQVIVSKLGGKKRLVIDYSQTVNKYSYLDAYPLPRMDQLVQEIAKVDLKSTYYQVDLDPDDKEFTAFQGNGKLYKFTRLPLVSQTL